MTISADRPPLSRLRLAGRLFVLMLLVVGMIAVWLNRTALDPNAIRSAIEAHSALAPLFFLLLHVLASLFFVPRTLMGLVAGGAFDFWWGLVWAATGSVLGAIAGFLIARYVNSGMIDLESLPKLGPVLQRAEAGGWRAVTMLRLIPVIPHSFTNYALGLTRLSLGGYALGSFLGQLPMTIAYVSLGAAGGRVAAGEHDWLLPALVGAVALALSILLPRWSRVR
ncbi:MAG TPA: VTT domain-containing protein [Stellaceae bacterium]|nr:VTT domain-containing protein [Stellaceae bacterium]